MKNQNSEFGLFLRGTFLGMRQVNGTSQKTNEAYTLTYFGIETPKENGFDGETLVHQIQISRDLLNSGITRNIDSMIGKQVIAEVYVRAFPTRGGASYQLNLANNLAAVQVQESKIKAA